MRCVVQAKMQMQTKSYEKARDTIRPRPDITV